MGDTPVGEGWVVPGDLVVVATRPPYQGVPLNATERPSSAPATVLCEGVQLRVEAVRGCRAQVRGIAGVDVEGWIRLCAADGTPFVQPLWLARQASGRPGSAGAAQGREGTEKELEALLEAHGIPAAQQGPGVLALQGLLRRREAILLPQVADELALHADVAVLHISSGGMVLVETHRERGPAGVAAAAGAGALPRQLRRAGESWAGCATRALGTMFGLTPAQVAQLFTLSEAPDPDAAVPWQPPVAGLPVQGEVCHVRCVCAAAPAGATASGVHPLLGEGRPFVTQGDTLDRGEDWSAAGAPADCRYWAWWSEAVRHAVEAGRERCLQGGRLEGGCLSEEVLWVAKAVLGQGADCDVQELSPLSRRGGSVLLVAEPRGGSSSSSSSAAPAHAPAVLRVEVSGVAGRPASDAAAGELLEHALGECLAKAAVTHASGATAGVRLHLSGVAWQVPELSSAGASLLVTLESVLRAATLRLPAQSDAVCEDGSLCAALVAELPHLMGRLGALLGGAQVGSGIACSRCEQDLLEVYADLATDAGLPQEFRSAWRNLRQDPSFAPAQWRPLAFPRLPLAGLSHVLVDALGSAWLCPGGQGVAAAPMLADLGVLVTCAILEGVVLPVGSKVLAGCAAGLSPSDLATWLGVGPPAAARLLASCVPSPTSPEAGEVLLRSAAAAEGCASRERASLRRLRALVLAGGGDAEAAAASEEAAALSKAFVAQLPRWGEITAWREHGEDTEELSIPGGTRSATWAAAAWDAAAQALRAGAASFGAALSAAKRRGTPSAQVDTSPLLLLLPMLRAARDCEARAAPWQRAWVTNHVHLLALQAAVALNRARAAVGPEWSPLWLGGRASSASALPAAAGAAAVAYAEGMRVLTRLAAPALPPPPAAAQHRPRVAAASDDPAVDRGVAVSCSGEDHDEGEGLAVLHGLSCAAEGIDLDQAWLPFAQLASGAVPVPPPEAPAEVLAEWAATARALRRSCAFRWVLAVEPGEGCKYTVEDLPQARRREAATPAGAAGAGELVFHGCRLGAVRAKEGILRLRLDQRTICSPPCRAWSLQDEVLEVDLGGGEQVRLVLKLSAPFFWYPVGARIAVDLASAAPASPSTGGGSSGSRARACVDLRESTVLNFVEGCVYQVRLDGGPPPDGSSSRVRLAVGTHLPAGVFRYAAGQRLAVHCGGGRWRDGVVEGRGAGTWHELRMCDADPSDPAAAPLEEGGVARLRLDLNSRNHAPAWLPAADFERALGAQLARLLVRCASAEAPLDGAPLDVMAQPLLLTPAHGSSEAADAWPRLRAELLRPCGRSRLEGRSLLPCFAVSGGPRSGKTLLLQRVAATVIRAGGGWLPLFLSGDELAAEMEADPHLTGDLLLLALERRGASADPGRHGEFALLLRQALCARRCVVLLDDLDAAGRMRSRIEAHLLQLARSGHRVLYTHAGPPPKVAGADAPFEHLRLLALDAPRERLLVEQRLGVGQAAEDFLRAVAPPACGNPAMLQLLLAAAVHRDGAGGGGAAAAYSAAVAGALARAGFACPPARLEGARRTLEAAAFEAHRQRLGGPTGPGLREAELRAGLGPEDLSTFATLVAAAAAGRLPLLRVAGAAGASRFAHISLQEYLCAARLARLLEADPAPEALAARVPPLRTLLSDNWWARVLEFLAGGFSAQCAALLRRGVASWDAARGPVEASPLYLAVERGLPGIVALLLDLGLPAGGVQHRCRHMYGSLEETPLCCAAARGAAEAVELLLDQGAEVGGFQTRQMAPTGEVKERTPLFCAAERGHLAVAALLLRRGASAIGPQYREEGGSGGRGRTKACGEAASTPEMSRLLAEAGGSPVSRPGTGLRR